jgi:hypothetical protein
LRSLLARPGCGLNGQRLEGAVFGVAVGITKA